MQLTYDKVSQDRVEALFRLAGRDGIRSRDRFWRDMYEGVYHRSDDVLLVNSLQQTADAWSFAAKFVGQEPKVAHEYWFPAINQDIEKMFNKFRGYQEDIEHVVENALDTYPSAYGLATLIVYAAHCAIWMHSQGGDEADLSFMLSFFADCVYRSARQVRIKYYAKVTTVTVALAVIFGCICVVARTLTL